MRRIALFCLTDTQCQNYRRCCAHRWNAPARSHTTISRVFSCSGGGVPLAPRWAGALLPGKRPFAALLTVEQPIQFVEVNEGDATAGKMQVVAQVQEYIQSHLSERLTLADVAAVFNFSPNYLSQLFGKYGDSGFVEYITETVHRRQGDAEQGDLKIYDRGKTGLRERLLFFPRCSKRSRGPARGIPGSI